MNLCAWRTSKLVMTMALALVATTACNSKRNSSGGGGSDPTPGSGTGAGPAATGPILIGHFASMSGAEATFGQSTDNGVRLAMEERNAAIDAGKLKGRKIEVKTLDDQGKTQEAGTAVNRLINEDHVVAILGEVASGLSLAGGAVAQHYSVPMISPSSTNPQVTQVGDMIFRVCFLDEFQGKVMAKFAKDELKATKVAILFDQSQPYSQGLADFFEKPFTEAGGTIVTRQAYNSSNPDVSAQLSSVKEAAPDLVVLPGYYTQAANIARQARKLDITVPFLGGDGWDSSKLEEIGGDAVQGSYYSNHYSPEEQSPVVQEFVKKYQAKYNQLPDGLAALGYDAANLLFQAIDKSPSLSGKDLAATIAASKDFVGVTGAITIDPNRDASKSAVVVQVDHGKRTPIKRYPADLK
ncbi:MAG: ABC transporter substrate-binding protein [Deltaproteobacteria bacterium]|nr:ABC transporter substrate-binding protein [Deltaproteobacteria bacterium]